MKEGSERKYGPAIADIEKISIPDVQKVFLSNGIPVHIINAGTQEIIKIELVSLAGRAFEKERLVAKPTSSLVKEGTASRSSDEIADYVDFYGASLVTRSGMDNSSISLYSLTKHLDKLLPLFIDVLSNPLFPEEELDRLKKINAKSLKIELSKNDVKAYRYITEHIFGENHVYGYNSEPEDYQLVNRSQLIKHYQEIYITRDTEIFIAGKVDDSLHRLIIDQLDQLSINTTLTPEYNKVSAAKKGRYDYFSDTEHQTALRIGKRVIPRTHTDFHDLFYTNTLFGGYFGSRLMKEVREKQGYTYGIYSLIDAMKYEGSWLISTEVSNEFLEDTINACHQEINRLQQDLASEQEIKMVRNYLMGHYMTMVDGPFKTAQLLKMLRFSGLNFDYFKEFIEQTKAMEATKVRDIATKYFAIEDLITVTVGSN